MFKLTTKRLDTRELLRAEHRLSLVRPSRFWLWSLAAMLCLIAGLLYLRMHESAVHDQQLARLVSENQVLQGVFEQRQLERQEAEATQEQLLGRIAQLSAQVDRLQTDLAFFRQQKNARK